MLAGDGAQIDTTTAAGRLVFDISATLAEFELAERRFALDEGLRRLAAAARAGAVAGGSIEDSVLRVERTETAVPDGAADLVADLYRRLPEARSTNILLEVDDTTRDRIGLLNVLIAEGINHYRT